MIGRLLEASKREQRSDTISGMSINDPAFWGLINAGSRTKFGSVITEDKALGCAAWFCAFDLQANDMGSMGFFTYRRMDKDDREIVADHPAYKLLHDSPNSQLIPFDFVRLLTYWRMAWGNGFAEIERNNRGLPIALWPIHPSRVFRVPFRDTAGRLVYRVSNDSAQAVDIPAENMLHIKGYSRDGVWGIGLIGVARESIGEAVSANEYSSAFYENGAQPTILLKLPASADDSVAEAVRANWLKRHGRASKLGVGVLDAGIEPVFADLTNQDSQHLETRTYQTLEVARFTHTPPHMLMEMSRSTFSNIEHQSIQYKQMALVPHAKSWEQECTRKLVAERDRGKVFCEFDFDTLLRGDMAARSGYFHTMLNDGVLSANEVRRIENWNRQPSAPKEPGDQYRVQVNTKPSDLETQKAEAAAGAKNTEAEAGAKNAEAAKASAPAFTPPSARDDAFADLMRAAVLRLARVESDKCGRAIKKPDSYPAWCKTFIVEHRERIRSELSHVITAYRVASGRSASSAMVDVFVNARAESLTKLLVEARPEAIIATAERDAAAMMTMLIKWKD